MAGRLVIFLTSSVTAVTACYCRVTGTVRKKALIKINITV